ncbi:hypothetical protein MNBD_UNCLBAC01-1592, partial [hydrothermal vent metagenome]
MRKFLSTHPYILTFGAFQIFFSAPGQTFLISLFVVPIFQELGVSQSAFAGIYSAATLSAALFLSPIGRLIDKYHVQSVIKIATVCMAIGCFILASTTNLIVLFIGFFILRLIGQGIFGLTSSTLMIKKFEKNRGKSMGIITLGFPISEAIYPSIALLLISIIGWRLTYVLFGMSNVLLMLPLQLYLLKKSNIKYGEFFPGEIDINPQHLRGNPEERKIRPHKNCTLAEVIKDRKFYFLLAASCLPPMVVTGLFFHQGSLFESNQWPISLAATGIFTYALFKACGSVYMGVIVDRYGPLAPFVALIMLLGMGTFLASLGGSTVVIFIYFALIGAALGFSSP